MFLVRNVNLFIVESFDLSNASGVSKLKFKAVYTLETHCFFSNFLSLLNVNSDSKFGRPYKTIIKDEMVINDIKIDIKEYLIFLFLIISLNLNSIILFCSFSCSILLGIDFFVLTINDFKTLLSSTANSFLGLYFANLTKSALFNTDLKLSIISTEILIFLESFNNIILSIN